MDPITNARNEYEAAKAAHDTARATMVARTKASGQHFHNRAELKAVDRLHKAMAAKGQALYQLQHAAA
jgi:hypothetical protein